MKRWLIAICTILLLLFGCAAAEEDVLYPIEENGKFGYINRTGEVVVEPQFAEVSQFDDYGTALVRHEDGLYSLIDHTGSIIITCPEITRNAISYNLYGWHEDLYDTLEKPFFEGMGLYSPTTKTIIYFDGMIYDEPNTDPSSTRVLVADENDTYGYLDRTTGEVVIPLQYKSICYDWTQMSSPEGSFFVAYDFAVFHEGYAVVGDKAENYFLIDESGKAIDLPGGPVTNVHEGKLNIRTPELGWQVCTVEGEVISDYYDEIRSYQNGYCGAINWHTGPEFFILDAQGQEKLHQNSFSGHEKFCGFETWNGYFMITEGSSGEYAEIYHVDKGRLCTIPYDPMAIDYDRELMVVDDGLRPVLCKLDGTEIFPLPYNAFSPDEYEFFEDGLWRLCADNEQGYRRYGYLREDGTWKIPPQYFAAEPFRNGLALCTDEEGYSLYIDTEGSIIWKSNAPSDVSAQKARLDRAGIWYQVDEDDVFHWLCIGVDDWDNRIASSQNRTDWYVKTYSNERLEYEFPPEELTRSALEASWNRYDDSIKPVQSVWHRSTSTWCDQYIRLYQDGSYEITEGFDQYYSDWTDSNALTLTDFGKVENQQLISSVPQLSPAPESWFSIEDGQLHYFRKGTVFFRKNEELSNEPGHYDWYDADDSPNRDILPWELTGEIELRTGGTWVYEFRQERNAFWTQNGNIITLTTMEGKPLQLMVDESQSQLIYEGIHRWTFLPGIVETEDQRNLELDTEGVAYQEGVTLPDGR